MNISKHAVVTLNYTLKNDQEQIIDTSSGGEPLVYLHGVGGLIPGLETELTGKSKGETFSVIIEPEDAYGVKDDTLLKVVPMENFEGDEELKVGMKMELDTDHGPTIAVIAEVGESEITLDLNHPLADQKLYFEIEVVDIRKASEDEIAHEHVHGAGGHHH